MPDPQYADPQRPISDSDLELLSAFIDGVLSDSERREVQTRLDHEAELQAVYLDLQRTIALLKSLPTLRAPRSYALTPDMVGMLPRAQTLPRRRSIPFAMTTAFSALSAAAAVILLVIGANMLTLNSSRAPQPAAVGMLPPTVTSILSATIVSDNADAAANLSGGSTGSVERAVSPTAATLGGELGDFNNAAPLSESPLQDGTVDQAMPVVPPIDYSMTQADQQAQTGFSSSSEAYGQGFSENSSGQAMGGGAAPSGAASAVQDVLPTTVAPLTAMQPVAPMMQATQMPSTATKSPLPTVTASPSDVPTDTPSDTPSDTPAPTLTAAPIPSDAGGSQSSGSANSIFGIVLIGTALFFAAVTTASVWARRQFNRNNEG